METTWETLARLRLYSDAKTDSRTQTAYGNALNDGMVDGDLSAFEAAVDAVERGCGFVLPPEWAALCKAAEEEDRGRLLKLLETKTRMLEVVLLLGGMSEETKLWGLETDAFSKPVILFECMRQLLLTDLRGEGHAALSAGLCRLAVRDSGRFRKLLHRCFFSGHREPALFAQTLQRLSGEGWAEVGRCARFDSFAANDLAYMDRVGEALDWEALWPTAQPFLDCWFSYLKDGVQKRNFGLTLYNNASNWLISLLLCKLDTHDAYAALLERAIHSCEETLNQWFERETQQRNVLLAHLSLLTHLRYVWDNRASGYAAPFPERLGREGAALLEQWRFLWEATTPQDQVRQETTKLLRWLEDAA